MSQPRTLIYFVLRACERFGLRDSEFLAADYDTQLRWLTYDALRRSEEAQFAEFVPKQSGDPR